MYSSPCIRHSSKYLQINKIMCVKRQQVISLWSYRNFKKHLRRNTSNYNQTKFELKHQKVICTRSVQEVNICNLIKSGICKSHKNIRRIRADGKPFSSFLTPQDMFFSMHLALSMKNAVQYLPKQFFRFSGYFLSSISKTPLGYCPSQTQTF